MTARRGDDRRPGPAGRPGFALLEVAVSVLVIAIAMALTLRLVSWLGAEQRGTDRRLWAAAEASNLLERLTREPFERLTTDRARELADGLRAGDVLPGAECSVDVRDDDTVPGVPGKRVAVALRWKGRSGAWVAPVRLAGWVYRERQPEREGGRP